MCNTKPMVGIGPLIRFRLTSPCLTRLTHKTSIRLLKPQPITHLIILGLAHMGPTSFSLCMARGPRRLVNGGCVHTFVRGGYAKRVQSALLRPHLSPQLAFPFILSRCLERERRKNNFEYVVRKLQIITWQMMANPWLPGWGGGSASPPLLVELNEIHCLRQAEWLMVAHGRDTFGDQPWLIPHVRALDTCLTCRLLWIA